MRTCKVSQLPRCYLIILGPVYLSVYVGDVGAFGFYLRFKQQKIRTEKIVLNFIK